MKTFMEGHNDYVLQSRFSETMPASSSNEKVKGRMTVNYATVMTPIKGADGYPGNTFIETYISKGDIIKLYEAIQEIESKEAMDFPTQSLPF